MMMNTVNGAPRSWLAWLSATLVLVLALVWEPDAASSQVATRCSVEGSGGLRFGAYNVFDVAPVDAVGTLLIECTGIEAGMPVVIELGRGGEGGFLGRALRNARHELRYQVYLDAARTVIWGDGTGGTSVMRVRPPDGRPLSIPLFGRVPPRQNVSPGDYSDELLVTIEY